ncbi:hypothetical protein ACG74X_11735 [Marivita sp. S0852]|uniref:hypothetical protein n=1 Tax=Marivita sp. S0852 TaxID=3373893 RepID=UPI003982ABF2
MNLKVCMLSRRRDTFGYIRATAHPEFPPNGIGRIEVRRTNEEGPCHCGLDRLNPLKSVKVLPCLVSRVFSIPLKPAPQKSAGVIRYKNEGAFRSVVSPI